MEPVRAVRVEEADGRDGSLLSPASCPVLRAVFARIFFWMALTRNPLSFLHLWPFFFSAIVSHLRGSCFVSRIHVARGGGE